MLGFTWKQIGLIAAIALATQYMVNNHRALRNLVR